MSKSYFAIFQSHTNCFCVILVLTSYREFKASNRKNKTLKIINFAPFNAYTSPLSKTCNILKFTNIVNVESCIFVNARIPYNKSSFSIFAKHFKLARAIHLYSTRSERNGLLLIPSYITLSDSEKN